MIQCLGERSDLADIEPLVATDPLLGHVADFWALLVAWTQPLLVEVSCGYLPEEAASFGTRPPAGQIFLLHVAW